MPVSAIRPNARQPRRTFPQSGLEELAASIREVGVLQPLVVRSTPGGFELIAGERRLRAAKEAGLDRVPVLIRQAGDNESMELALVENLQRENLSPLETAAAYQALMDGFGLTKDQLASRLGKSRAAVTNTLRLTQLPEPLRDMLGDGRLSEGHARALLGLRTEEQMVRLAGRVHSEKLSVRQTEEMVRDQPDQPGPTEPSERTVPETPQAFDEASRMMREAIELPVRVKSFRRGGKVEIRFTEAEQLEAIVSLLTSRESR
ncbi:MAG: Chromosome (plasmid) partitioning protein ParB [uncultured Rubrobacteraceae bacterium]|uniref:Chromosome (Plasmid) partitioning protein ParB n=1 Tax=uncultured Rubrobacteraceae bacterium TaxID=349277 RepID=A0A6J4QHP7_9ACTN|nr:MAG: Chromosome (plasmid) partitioning protein ParB [uncultured Rubrobacteraceae bacterium]